ncbi:hypothetical protein MSG28_012526 [Choristoneura fumiferana]|uniref:Uncharacterized protein n=1 Tax=Choristoneura fumiferana TaxID=7141 RepID=A0ACC0KE77_CHOFU|nr:hypothetical protein MSG28_012526 [Choristoneura fumiferana]
MSWSRTVSVKWGNEVAVMRLRLTENTMSVEGHEAREISDSQWFWKLEVAGASRVMSIGVSTNYEHRDAILKVSAINGTSNNLCCSHYLIVKSRMNDERLASYLNFLTILILNLPIEIYRAKHENVEVEVPLVTNIFPKCTPVKRKGPEQKLIFIQSGKSAAACGLFSCARFCPRRADWAFRIYANTAVQIEETHGTESTCYMSEIGEQRTMRKTHIVVALGCIFQLVTARTLKNTKVDVNYYETNKAVENKLKEIDDVININDQAIEELEHDYLKNNKGVKQTAMENGSIDELDDDESFDKVNETENERKKEVSPPPGSRRFRRWAMARPCANGSRKVYLGKHRICVRY